MAFLPARVASQPLRGCLLPGGSLLSVVAHTERPHPALPGAGTSGPFAGKDPAVLNLEELLGLSCIWQRDRGWINKEILPGSLAEQT